MVLFKDIGSEMVQNLKKQDNYDYVCINRDDCMSSDNLCVSNSMNDVKFRAKPKKNKSKKDIWKHRNRCSSEGLFGNYRSDLHIVEMRNPLTRKNKNTESVSKTKVIKPMSANKQEPSKSWGSTKTNIPSTSLNECSQIENDQLQRYGLWRLPGLGMLLFQGLLSEGLGIIYSLWVNSVNSNLEAVALNMNILYQLVHLPILQLIKDVHHQVTSYDTRNSKHHSFYDVEEDNHDIEVDLWVMLCTLEIPIPEVTS
ncbi:hypothetical protein Tco_0006340 [Tanacetum coccineum]